MQFTIFHKSCFFLLFWATENSPNFKFQLNFTIKNRRTGFECFISYLFDEIHCSTICYMIRLVFICQNPGFKKTTINFGTFVTGLKPTSWCLLGLLSNQNHQFCLVLFLFFNLFWTSWGKQEARYVFFIPPNFRAFLPAWAWALACTSASASAVFTPMEQSWRALVDFLLI